MALGRGLQSIIPVKKVETATVPSSTAVSGAAAHQQNTSSHAHDKIWHIPVSEIRPNPEQPRRVFNEEDLGELVNSIREHGVMQPIIVTELRDGLFELVAGERRMRAAKRAGLATIPTIVRNASEHEKLELAIIENVQRVDLSPIDEAFSYKRLYDEFGLNLDQVAQRVGKSRPHISNLIRLLELPESAKEALASGKITMGKARALLSLSTENEQLDVLASMLGEGMNTREVEAAVQLRLRRVPKPKATDVQYLESELRQTLGTKVTITKRGDKGTVTIEFYSNEELENLIARMRKI